MNDKRCIVSSRALCALKEGCDCVSTLLVTRRVLSCIQVVVLRPMERLCGPLWLHILPIKFELCQIRVGFL